MGVPVLFCTGVGVAESRQEVGVLRLSRPLSPSCRSRRRIPASCPFLEIDAGHIRPNMIDLLAANIAASGLFQSESNHPQRGDEANIDDLPTGLAVSRGPTLVQRTSLAAKAGVAWADVHLPHFRSVTNRKEIYKHRRARPEKWPDRLCGNHPANRSAPQETLGLPRWPLAGPASAVTSEF